MSVVSFCYSFAISLYIFCGSANGLSYGPPLTDILSATQADESPRKITLQHYKDYSIVIPLRSNNRTTATVRQLSQLVRNGSFLVEAPEDHGVMGVIQKLKLRRNSESGDCLDFLEVNPCSGNCQWRESTQTCGNIAMNEGQHGILGPTNFVFNFQQIQFNFVLGNAASLLLAEMSPFDSDEFEIQFELVLTAYKLCYKKLNATAFTYQPCKSANICISSRLFCDGVSHCGTKGIQATGYDEQHCTEGKYTLPRYNFTGYRVVTSEPQPFPPPTSRSLNDRWMRFFYSVIVFASMFAGALTLCGLMYCISQCFFWSRKASSLSSSRSLSLIEIRRVLGSIVNLNLSIPNDNQRNINCSFNNGHNSISMQISSRNSSGCSSGSSNEEHPPAYDSLFPNTIRIGP